MRSLNGDLTWGSLVDQVQGRVSELNPEQEPIASGSFPRVILGRRAASRWP